MSTLKIFIFLVSCIESNFIGGHTAKYTPIYHNKNQRVVNESKSFWPSWSSAPCLPFWPFGRCDASPQVPLPSLLPPLLAPPIVEIPKILPPSSQLVPLIPIPTNLFFVDLRIELVYPVVQNFKNIITTDPLGITKTWVGSDLCSYKGFFCDIPPDNASAIVIASVDFNGYGLAAPTLDGFIDQLPDLALFHANSNQFSGTVSPNIAKLKYLYELDLSNNKFTGPFPQAVVGMEGLGFLDIRFNLFSGSVPPAIFTQGSLEVLFLNDNNFVSTLPETIGNTHILYLTLANNRFIGPIPHDIAKALSGLTQVLLLNNRLTGCLPYELGFLNQVTVLDISNNLLTGPLPFSLACLDRVELLDFSSNLLYGMVPDLLCHLPNLANLSLSDNYFTQVGPYCRMLISQGVLDVRNNCIPDLPFQRSMIECMTFLATPRICPHSETYGIVPCKPHFYP